MSEVGEFTDMHAESGMGKQQIDGHVAFTTYGVGLSIAAALGSKGGSIDCM